MTPLRIAPAGAFSVTSYPPGATFGPRQLTNHEFVWMIRGDAIYTADSIRHDAPENSLVLCKPGTTDAFTWDKSKSTRHAYFHFDLTGDAPASWPSYNAWATVRETGASGLIAAIWEHLLAWSGRGDTAQTELLCLSLLAAFVTGETDAAPIPAPALPDAVVRALGFLAHTLEENPAAKVSLAQIADAACVAPEHLCRLFRAHTAHSPAETVRLMRLDRALTLLARTNFSIAEIAALTGFDSPFHFSRRFSDVYGSSPRALRNAIIAGSPIPRTPLLRSA